MAIQYSSGVIVNTTFTATAIVDIVDNLKTAVVNAGWSVVSGSSGDWIVQSVATTQSLSFKVRIYDPGGGANCARINVRSSSGSLTGTSDMYLLPDATTWRIIAHPHAFYIQKDSSPSASKRDFACAGTLYIPSWLATPSEAVFSSGACLSDISSASVRSFRTALTNDGVNSNTGAYTTMYDGTMFNAGTFESGIGTLRFRCGASALMNSNDFTNSSASTFVDGTIFMDTPYICFGVAGSTSVATANGVLYDAAIVEASYSYGDTKTFDSKDWMAITHANIGNSTDRLIAGTLFVRIT